MTSAVDDARAAYAAFAAGEPDALAEWFDPEIEWVEPPELPGARTYSGRDRVVRYLSSIRDLWEEFDPRPGEFEETPDGLVVPIRIHARARGASVHDNVVHRITLRDGKALRIVVEQTGSTPR